jgi:hypothetical protein
MHRLKSGTANCTEDNDSPSIAVCTAVDRTKHSQALLKWKTIPGNEGSTCVGEQNK